MEKNLLRIIQYGTYLVLFTPLIVNTNFFFPFVGPKSLYFFALVEIIFFSYLILILKVPQYRPRLSPLLIILSIFLIILILSSIFGADLQSSFWSKYERMTGLLMWLHLLAFFLVLSSVFKKGNDWLKIFGVSIFVALLIALLSLFEKMGIGIIGASSRGGATLGNSSFLGTYLLFNLFLALYLFLKTNPEKLRSLFNKAFNFYSLLVLGIIGLALWFSTAQAALFSALGGVVLLGLFWLVFCRKGTLKYIGIAILTIGIIGPISLIALTLHSPDLVLDKLVQQFGSSTVKPRVDVYNMGWQGFKERPLLGWGPENFSLVFTKHFNPRFFLEEYGADIWYDRAHNIIFDTLAMTGILGFLGYLSLFAAVFYILWRKYFKEKFDFWAVSIFSVALVAYFVQNLTVFDMVNSYLMFFLVLGFVGSIASKPREETRQKKTKSKSWPTFIPISIILIFFIFSFTYFVIQPLRVDVHVILAVKTRPFSEQKLSLYKKTLAISPIGRDQILEFFADSTSRYAQSENIEELPKEVVVGEFDFISQELEKSIEKNPLNYRLHLKLGRFYNDYSRFDQSKLADADRVLEKAIQLSPLNQQSYWHLAQTKLFQRKINEALALAQTAVEVEPGVVKSHLVLIQIVRLTGDQELLRKKVGEALNINPEWATPIKETLGG